VAVAVVAVRMQAIAAQVAVAVLVDTVQIRQRLALAQIIQ
jgi:hypothetical protein